MKMGRFFIFNPRNTGLSVILYLSRICEICAICGNFAS